MTVALTKIRGRVRSRLRDADGRMDNPSNVDVDMAICDAYLALSADLPAPTLYTAAALTISAGSDLFTLPVTVASSGYGTGTTEYAGQVEIQLVSNGAFLQRKTLTELNAFRHGQFTLILGVPSMFALYEDNGQVVRGRCYVGAAAAQSCNLYSSLQVEDLRDYVGTGGAEALDTVSADLSRTGAAALVAYTAGMLLKRMDAKAVELRGLNPAVADVWLNEAATLMYHEAARRNALESNGETQRWVS